MFIPKSTFKSFLNLLQRCNYPSFTTSIVNFTNYLSLPWCWIRTMKIFCFDCIKMSSPAYKKIKRRRPVPRLHRHEVVRADRLEVLFHLVFELAFGSLHCFVS